MSQRASTDNAQIRAWTWSGPAGRTVNLFAEFDAEPLLRGPDVEREIARHLERLERSLRAALVPPSQVQMKDKTTIRRGRP